MDGMGSKFYDPVKFWNSNVKFRCILAMNNKHKLNQLQVKQRPETRGMTVDTFCSADDVIGTERRVS